MARAFRSNLPVHWRILLVLAVAFSATLVACGGGGGSGSTDTTTPPPGATSTVTGTAASGAALGNVTVTLKDSTNHAVTATTTATGSFTLDSSNLTPPFLLQVTTPGGTKLLSVSTDANRTATINVTPLSDVVVRSWFGVQGKSADGAFANPVTVPPPTAAQVRAAAQVLQHALALAISANGAPITDPADFIARPFTANGTGIDKLLDNTRVTVRSGAIDLVMTAGSATQTTTLAFSTATASITASSTTVDGTATTTATSTEVVPVQAAQATALDDINAALGSVATVINTKRSALTVADLEPFFAADLLNEGLDRTQFLAEAVQDFRQGQTVTFTLDRVRSLDLTAGRAEVELHVTESANGQTRGERNTFFFTRGSDGKWRFAGDGRIASISLQAEGRSGGGLFSSADDGPAVNFDVRPPLGVVTAVTASSIFTTPAFQRGATEVRDSGLQLDVFFANTGRMTPPLPVAGTPVTFTLTRSAGGTVSYTLPLNAFTTELIHVTSPTATTLPTGTTVTVAWTRPTTYVVERIQLSVMVFTQHQPSTSGFQCVDDGVVVAPTATSGSVVIPATCNGQPVVDANINVATTGPNGERSMVIYAVSPQ